MSTACLSSAEVLTKRDSYLRRRFGVTEAKYDELFNKQGRRCAICGIGRAAGQKSFPLDHDHKTGECRGILCFRCNKALIGRYRREHYLLFMTASSYLLGKAARTGDSFYTGWFVPKKAKRKKKRKARRKK